MRPERLVAFTDGVLAIIITITVLELRQPAGAALTDLRPVLPVFLSYVLSFGYLGTYWNNHHHMLHVTERVTGGMLWANLHLLFWLSLVPFVTGWMGENHNAAWPMAVYGVVLLMAAIAYYILEQTIIAAQGPDSLLKRALGRDVKGKLSLVFYMAGIGAAFVRPLLAAAVYVFVAAMWLVPDRRMERALEAQGRGADPEAHAPRAPTSE